MVSWLRANGKILFRGSALRAVPSPLHKKFRFPSLGIHALLQDTEPLPPVEGCRPEVFPVDLQAQLPAASSDTRSPRRMKSRSICP